VLLGISNHTHNFWRRLRSIFTLLFFKMDISTGIGGASSSLTPLNDSGVDFSNFTQAYNFQLEILDDSILQVIANSYARYFWYGTVVLIGIATLINIGRKFHLRMRYVKYINNLTNLLTSS
jgi:ferric-chelate reductase